MRQNINILIAVAICALFFSGCKKAANNSAPYSNAQQHNQDVSNTTSESNNVNTDVNSALINTTGGFGKNSSIQALAICGASIDSSHDRDPQPYIIITYDSTTNCYGTEVRSGQVKVQLVSGTHWSDMGAVLAITMTNYKITYTTLNGYYLIFNGTKYLTDVNGINWVTVYLGSSTATLRERSYNMLVTFSNGYSATWNSARLTTWGINTFTEVYATVNGDTTIGGQTTDSWGTDRFGDAFTTRMIQPWQSNTTCGWWSPVSGQYTSTVTGSNAFSVTALFGVNSGGTQVTSGCAYGFKLSWTITSSNSSGSAILAYW